jgi:hypothetical protein
MVIATGGGNAGGAIGGGVLPQLMAANATAAIDEMWRLGYRIM